jgi:hypothetical protein
MDHLMQADIHRAVIEALAELGKPHANLCCLNLKVLIRNGYYAEHTIQYEDIRISLLIGENLIEFYGEDGTLVKTATVDKDRFDQRKAA